MQYHQVGLSCFIQLLFGHWSHTSYSELCKFVHKRYKWHSKRGCSKLVTGWHQRCDRKYSSQVTLWCRFIRIVCSTRTVGSRRCNRSTNRCDFICKEWFSFQIEAILGQHGIVVISRSGSNPEKFIFESDLLNRYKVNTFYVNIMMSFVMTLLNLCFTKLLPNYSHVVNKCLDPYELRGFILTFVTFLNATF